MVIRLAKFCPNCGKEVKENSKFCENCGEALNTTKTTTETSTEQTTQTSQPKAEKVNEVAQIKEEPVTTSGAGIVYKKNVIVSVILCILPALGQFYNGQVLKGIVFMIVLTICQLINMTLYWIVFLIMVIDAFLSARAINQHNGNYFYNENLKGGA